MEATSIRTRQSKPALTAEPGTASDGAELAHAERAVDARVVAAWCEWLGAMATDAEAALAAAMAYRELDAPSRDLWITALEQDARGLGVPLIAVYAPLLAVESDPARRARITAALGPATIVAQPRDVVRALAGRAHDGLRVAVVIAPLYLDFVQVLAVGHDPAQGFEWVRHDPIVHRETAPSAGAEIGGAVLEAMPLEPIVDDLARTVLSHQRNGGVIPEAVRVFADLFGPGPGSGLALLPS
jgi:hypothetical protein